MPNSIDVSDSAVSSSVDLNRSSIDLNSSFPDMSASFPDISASSADLSASSANMKTSMSVRCIDITIKEWQIVQGIRDEFRKAAEDHADKLKDIYGGAVQKDESGSLLVRRIRKTEHLDCDRPGIKGLDHSFMITPKDDIIGFGRSNEFEDSVIGQGSFGRVREALIKSPADDPEAEPSHAAIKVLISKSPEPDPVVEHEIEVLEEFGHLKGHMKAQVKCKGKLLQKTYIAVELAPGQNLRETTKPEVTLSKVLRPLLIRERQLGVATREDSLHVALRTYEQAAKNPLAWKIEASPIASTGVTEPIKRFWREFLGRKKFPPHAQKLEMHVKSIVAQSSLLREDKKLLPYIDRVEYAIAATEALKDFHSRGFIHRDIKGLNMVGEQHLVEGRLTTTVRIVDLATAVHIDREDKPEHIRKDFVGSLAYASPELRKNFFNPEIYKIYSFESDIYALGKTFELDLDLQDAELGKKIIEDITVESPAQRPSLNSILNSLFELKRSLLGIEIIARPCLDS